MKHFTQGYSRKEIINNKTNEDDVHKREFEYFDNETNKKVTDQKILTRIKLLNIPPSWSNVWVSKNDDIPIQAVGIDLRNIKQYIYTKEHQKSQSEKKF